MKLNNKNPRGAGRKPNGTVPIAVRVTPAQKEWLQAMGQSETIRILIDVAMKRA
jgi:hypothetical protein